jgi:cell division cycle 20-like protein 1, cofactor of APC complex
MFRNGIVHVVFYEWRNNFLLNSHGSWPVGFHFGQPDLVQSPQLLKRVSDDDARETREKGGKIRPLPTFPLSQTCQRSHLSNGRAQDPSLAPGSSAVDCPQLLRCAAAVSMAISPSAVPYSRISATPPRPSRSAPSPASRAIYSCRFIPSRTGSNLHLFDLAAPASSSGSAAPESSPYSVLLRSALFGTPTPRDPGRAASSEPACSSAAEAAPPVGTPGTGNVFRFKADVPRSTKRALFAGGDEDGAPPTATGARRRKVPNSPYKKLDAPDLQDDFYLNLLDWSSQDLVAIGLGNSVYLRNSCGKVTMLCDLGMDDKICSVRWAQRDNHLAVGTNQGTVQIWDASRCKRIRTIARHHQHRVGSLAWSSSLLSSGSRDSTIFHHDIRAPEEYVGRITGHKSEVCGLQWSHDNSKLASGGDDNRLFVSDPHYAKPILKYKEHIAAVKTIAWSPHQHGLLASGGGIQDSSIRFWDTARNTQLSSMNTGSQVCNLVWSESVNELVSTHGYSQNQINVWEYPTMEKVAILTGHDDRVLYLAISPDGQNIATGAGGADESIRFWNLFPPLKSRSSHCLSFPGSTSAARSYIR